MKNNFPMKQPSFEEISEFLDKEIGMSKVEAYIKRHEILRDNGEKIDYFGIDCYAAAAISCRLENNDRASAISFKYLSTRAKSTKDDTDFLFILRKPTRFKTLIAYKGLNALFNDFRSGSSSARTALIELLQNTHKKEFKRICYLKVLDETTRIPEDIFDVKEEPEYDIESEESLVCLCLVMAQLMRIPICDLYGSMILFFSDRIHKEKSGYELKLKEDAEESPDEKAEKLRKYIDGINAAIEEQKDLRESGKPSSRALNRTISFMKSYCDICDRLDSPVFDITDLMVLKNGRGNVIAVDMERAFLAMKDAGIKPDMTYDEWVYFLQIGNLLELIFDDIEKLSNSLDFYTEFGIGEKKAEKKELTGIPSAKEQVDAKIRMEETIEEQKKRIESLEHALKEQHEKADDAVLKLKEAEARLEGVEDLRLEAAALRRFVYEQAQADKAPAKLTDEEMIAAIKDKRVCLVGGDENWVNKLKNILPDYVYLSPAATGSIPTNILDKIDYLYIFSSHICHPQYNRFLDGARIRGTKVSYIARVNIKENLRQFYEEMAEGKI